MPASAPRDGPATRVWKRVGQAIFQLLIQFLARYGYVAVFFGVMLENAGLPVPGETVLLLGGFTAHQGVLRLKWVVLTAILGAAVGDNLGYALGYYGGTALVRRLRGKVWLPARRYDQAERAVLRYGAWAVFTARFITGLRILAGPLAGAFRMRYGTFLLANVAGAVIWAAAIGIAGYALGTSWERLVHFVHALDWIILAALAVAAIAFLIVSLRARKR